MATVRIERERSRWQDWLRRYQVVIDGVRVGSLRNGETASYEVAAGVHRLYMKLDWMGSEPFEFFAESDATIDFRCRAGGATPARIVGSAFGRRPYLHLERVNDSQP